MKAVLRKAEAMEFVGLRHSQFDEKVLNGELPAPIKLTDSGHTVAWLRSELETWLEARVAKRDSPEGKAKREAQREARRAKANAQFANKTPVKKARRAAKR